MKTVQIKFCVNACIYFYCAGFNRSWAHWGFSYGCCQERFIVVCIGWFCTAGYRCRIYTVYRISQCFCYNSSLIKGTLRCFYQKSITVLLVIFYTEIIYFLVSIKPDFAYCRRCSISYVYFLRIGCVLRFFLLSIDFLRKYLF